MGQDRRRKQLEDAWLGDAVLGLYARVKILEEGGQINALRFAQMTSNQFLSGIGEPTSVEAEIGRLYRSEGLEKAFEWIGLRLIPVFNRQEANRLRRGE